MQPSKLFPYHTPTSDAYRAMPRLPKRPSSLKMKTREVGYSLSYARKEFTSLPLRRPLPVVALAFPDHVADPVAQPLHLTVGVAAVTAAMCLRAAAVADPLAEPVADQVAQPVVQPLHLIVVVAAVTAALHLLAHLVADPVAGPVDDLVADPVAEPVAEPDPVALPHHLRVGVAAVAAAMCLMAARFIWKN